MTEISGRLHLDLAANGTVGMSFVPGAGNAKRLWAGDAGSAETDLINRFGLPLNRASILRAELEKRGTVDEPVNIDEGIARNLYALQ